MVSCRNLLFRHDGYRDGISQVEGARRRRARHVVYSLNPIASIHVDYEGHKIDANMFFDAAKRALG